VQAVGEFEIASGLESIHGNFEGFEAWAKPECEVLLVTAPSAALTPQDADPKRLAKGESGMDASARIALLIRSGAEL
jgi:hypothetical protein